jgi:rare lipoprotein A
MVCAAEPEALAEAELAAEAQHSAESESAPAPSASTSRDSFRESGTASWYGPGFDGRRTASGERFNARALTAAHKFLPFGTRVRVTASDTFASVIVTINDRLPASSRHIIDLSRAAGSVLNIVAAGIARVWLEVID